MGTNALIHVTPEDYLDSLGKLIGSLRNMDSSVFVSELLPRDDNLRPLSDEVSGTLRQIVPDSNRIPHPNISHAYLYDAVHLRNKALPGERFSAVQLFARDFYISRYQKEPLDSRISRSLSGDHGKPRSRSNSRNRTHGQ